MNKTFKVASLIAFLTCFFSLLDVNASLKNQFKQEQTGKGDCNLQTSKWYGVSYYTGMINDVRFCFGGDSYRSYSPYDPNGTFGGKLNTKVRDYDRSLRDYYLTEIAIDDDYFIEYKCQAYTNNWDCRGPITKKVYGARDYLAYYSDAEAKNNKWEQDPENAKKLEATINSYTNSINLNPLNNKFRKKTQVFAYMMRAFRLENKALRDIGIYKRDYDNPKVKGNKYLKQAIQDITNAIELEADKSLKGIFDRGVLLGMRANYKLSFYNDRKYGCNDLSKAIDLGDEQAKGYFNEFCL